MDRPRFHRVERLFEAAAELPETERAAYLERHCPDEPDVRAEVRRLLSRLDQPLAVHGVPHAAKPLGDRLEPGSTIGHYRIRELIGEGGFGCVYRAEQEQPVRREVALKIVKPGMDSRQVLARFELERRALARMDHPHIARVIDAGVGGFGRPYFVMDLVRGIPITTFGDEHRLDLDTRLDLFLQVCAAVQHAHQKGIIHRDLKPSNVLVSDPGDGPHCRIIDFGIAKALDEHPDVRVTVGDQLMGTPAYMSPEQAAGAVDIDTRADIYALGVILYELLTGTTPHGPGDFAERSSREIRRLIEEKEPPRPSTRIAELGADTAGIAAARRTDGAQLRRAVRGDLDWIVMRAIDKSRARRYETAAELAADVRRFQRGEAVLAGPPGVRYRMRKFAGRHRVAVTLGTLAAVALVVGGTVATAGMISARRAHVQAQHRLADSYLDQIRLLRETNTRGRRARSLELVALAAEIEPSLTLRNEAIACLTLTDFEVVHRLPIPAASPFPCTMLGLDACDRFARTGEDGSVVICDRTDGSVLARLRGSPRMVRHVVFSPRGRYVAVKHHEDAIDVVVWDVEREAPVLEQVARSNVLSATMAFAPDASWIALGDPAGRIERFELPSGRQVDVIDLGGRPRVLSVSPDNGRLAVGLTGDPVVRILDPDDDAATVSIATEEEVVLLQFDRRGARLATAGPSGVIAIWDVATAQRVQTLRGHQGLPRWVYFDRTGALLASVAWDGTARVWDLDSGREVVEPFAGHWTAGFDEELYLSHGGELMAWVDERVPVLRELPLSGRIGEVPVAAIAPGGRLAAVAAERGLHLCDLERSETIGQVLPERWVYSVLFTRDGEQLVAATDHGVVAWDLQRRDDRVRLDERRVLTTDRGTSRVCLAGDGRTVLVCGPRATTLVDLDEPASTVVLADGARWGHDPSYSADGRWCFTGTWRGPPATLWDAVDRVAVQEFEGESVAGRFDPTGRCLLVSAGRAYRALEVGTWRERFRFDRTGAPVGPMAFRADGVMAAVALSEDDVTLIDVATGTPLATLTSPGGERIKGLAFSPDGATLVAVARAGAPLRIWDLRRLRTELAAWGLDWDHPPLPDPAPRSDGSLRLVTPRVTSRIPG